MSDTVVERKGFGTRMKNSFTGIFFGIIMVIIGIVVLVINERSNVINIKNVKELRDVYVDVKSDNVDKDSDGKLVVTSGTLGYGDEVLTDEVFGISVKAPILERKVEIYQWVEDTEESDDKTTYKYTKEWSDEVVDSSKFKEQSGHENNGSMPYSNNSYQAKELNVGAYKLSSDYFSLLSVEGTYNDLSAATVPEGYKVSNGYITNSEDSSNPKVGDVRISFAYASYSDVTVMGKLNGSTITEYVTKKGSKITYLTDGIHDGEYVINSIEKGNKAMKWILRLIGTILIIGGVASVFGPLKTITSYVPILGSIVGGATGLIALFVGLAISLVVIAISWIVFRPVLGICLLVAAIGLIVLIKSLLSKKQLAQQQNTNIQQ